MSSALPTGESQVETIEVFHADSLAGPMRALQRSFAQIRPDLVLRLTSGVSRQLAERIAQGERCDVFVSSSPAVIEAQLMISPVPPGRRSAGWYAVFSANEMVLIVAPRNPLAIRHIGDLLRPGIRLARVTGEDDLATARSLDFIRRAAALEGLPEAADAIVAGAPAELGQPVPVPAVVRAVVEGRADAGIVYLSAAVAAGEAISYIRFPASVNMSEAIRSAVTIPVAAGGRGFAESFVAFLLAPKGRKVLERSGQPPIVPPQFVGTTPARLKEKRR